MEKPEPNQIQPNRPFRVSFPKPEAKHKLGGPFKQAADLLGLEITPRADNGMIYQVTDPNGRLEPFELIYGRPADALKLIELGAIDLAVSGKDIADEHKYERLEQGLASVVETRADLGFAGCTLVAAVPDGAAESMLAPADLLSLRKGTGKLRVATSFTNTVTQWLDGNGIDRNDVEFIPLDGGVEIAIGLGVADMVCDLKQSGASLKKARLTDVFNVAAPSTALLVTRQGVDTPQVTLLIRRIQAACDQIFATAPADFGPEAQISNDPRSRSNGTRMTTLEAG